MTLSRTPASSYDVIVIGSGHNGLTAALRLARAGRSVAVLEASDEVGGAIASGEVTLPGFTHDLYSTNQNQLLGSQVYAEFGDEFRRHGLGFVDSAHPVANAFPDGSTLRVFKGFERTVEELGSRDPRDAAAFRELYRVFQQFGPSFKRLTQGAVPSRHAAGTLIKAATGNPPHESMRFAQLMLMSTRALGDQYFATPEARSLFACWGLHADFAPDISGGATLPLMSVFSATERGMAITSGGAGAIPRAFGATLRELGGEIHTGARVTEVITENNRAAGVRDHTGRVWTASQAVVAGVTPTSLYGDLLASTPVSARTRRAAGRFQYGPGTLMMHVALDGPTPWASPELADFAYVHIGPYVDDLARSYQQARSGILPDTPLLIVGQTSVVDPTRAPAGKHILWIQARSMPSAIRGDARDEIRATTWDDAREAMGDRLLTQLEQYAPGVRSRVLATAVLTPADLERANANLVGGDSVAGSHHLAQNFIMRPLPGWSRYRTPVDRLYLTGASTWPGGGNNATSGWLAAGAVLADARTWRQWKTRLGRSRRNDDVDLPAPDHPLQ